MLSNDLVITDKGAAWESRKSTVRPTPRPAFLGTGLGLNSGPVFQSSLTLGKPLRFSALGEGKIYWALPFLYSHTIAVCLAHGSC